MKILILGGGGREHALAWKMSQSPSCKALYIAPGNAGTSLAGTNIELDPEDFQAVAGWVREHHIDLIIPGPEAPIVDGIYDYFESNGLLRRHCVLAPDKNMAALEGSKLAAKRFMHKYKIPTSAYASFAKGEWEKALDFIRHHQLPMVIKADGLAAGKGVMICHSQQEAEDALYGIMKEDQFGKAGSQVIIEEFLEGEEVSVFALTDGKNLMMFPDARDYKRAGEGDTGPNTGGMGAFSPSGMNESFMEKVKERVVKPTLRGIEMEDGNYKGFLFFGLMNTGGNPFVLEYNVRLGDPEAEVILPRINEDFAAICMDAAKGKLSDKAANIVEDVAVTVMLTSAGYPGKYEKGKKISGLEAVSNSVVFHAGTKRNNGDIVTSGGRVLAVTSMDKSLTAAVEKSYSSIDKIDFDGKAYRKDIGKNIQLTT